MSVIAKAALRIVVRSSGRNALVSRSLAFLGTRHLHVREHIAWDKLLLKCPPSVLGLVAIQCIECDPPHAGLSIPQNWMFDDNYCSSIAKGPVHSRHSFRLITAAGLKPGIISATVPSAVSIICKYAFPVKGNNFLSWLEFANTQDSFLSDGVA